MITFIFDYDKSRKMGIIQSNYLDNLREHFSVDDPAAYIKRMKYGNYVSTRHYCITQSGRFKVGMFIEIVQYIKSLNIPYKIILTQPLKEIVFSDYKIETLKELSIPLRDYQELAVRKCLKQGNGVIVSATASGKTLIIASLIETIRANSSSNHKTIVLVPGIQLVEQTYKDFLEYGIDKNVLCKWSGENELDITAKIIIAGLNILQSKKTDLSILSKCDLIIGDEIHKWRVGNKINKLLKYVNTYKRFGFTGTLPENKIDEWNIIGSFGPILMKKTSKELSDNKFISDALVQILRIKYNNPLVYKTRSTFLDPTSRYNEECEYIYKQAYRNTIIAGLSNKVEKNILILVDRIEHGEILKQTIENNTKNKTVYFIRGSVDVDDREEIRKIMENKDNVVCIAITSIFSTGINIKNLHYILFACAGKAKIKIIQSIGRGLRLHEHKDKLIIFDISDKLEYSTKHLGKRISLYKKEKIKYAIKEIDEK